MTELSRDEQDLARFGYKQELKRSLGVFSSFAVAFSYISPSTGIFALFFLGLTTVGGVFIWSWPIVAIGQLIVALGFAELSSHYPVAGSVFQWTKYLAGKSYSWFTGWIYLFAGILTVASVCATLPYALIPAFNNMGWNVAIDCTNQRWIAVITLVADHDDEHLRRPPRRARQQHRRALRDPRHGRLRVHRRALPPSSERGRDLPHEGHEPHGRDVPRRHVHGALRHLRVRHRVDTLGGDEEPADRGAEGGHRIGHRRVRDRRHLPVRDAARHPEHARRDQGRLGPGADHRRELRQRVLDGVPARRLGRDLRLLPRDRDVDDPAVLRHVA